MKDGLEGYNTDNCLNEEEKLKDNAYKAYQTLAGDMSSILGQDDPPEKELAMHSSILAWRVPWTEESGYRTAWLHGFAQSWT